MISSKLSAVILTALLISSIGAVAADSEYTITVENGEVDVPDRTEKAAGVEFTVTSVAPIEPGDDITASVAAGGDVYDLQFRDSDNKIVDSSSRISGDTTVTFGTDQLDPGGYVLDTYTGEYEYVQPVVITAYETSVSSPSQVTVGNNVSIDIDTTEHDNIDAPPIQRVEIAFANESMNKRFEATETDGTFRAEFSADYAPGEYRLYAVVAEDESTSATDSDVIGLSQENTIDITEQSDSGSDGSGSDDGGNDESGSDGSQDDTGSDGSGSDDGGNDESGSDGGQDDTGSDGSGSGDGRNDESGSDGGQDDSGSSEIPSESDSLDTNGTDESVDDATNQSVDESTDETLNTATDTPTPTQSDETDDQVITPQDTDTPQPSDNVALNGAQLLILVLLTVALGSRLRRTGG